MLPPRRKQILCSNKFNILNNYSDVLNKYSDDSDKNECWLYDLGDNANVYVNNVLNKYPNENYSVVFNNNYVMYNRSKGHMFMDRNDKHNVSYNYLKNIKYLYVKMNTVT